MTRLAISNLEVLKLDPEDYRVITRTTDFYLLRIIREANKLGLAGKEIKDIVTIEEKFSTNVMFIDFTCE